MDVRVYVTFYRARDRPPLENPTFSYGTACIALDIYIYITNYYLDISGHPLFLHRESRPERSPPRFAVVMGGILINHFNETNI